MTGVEAADILKRCSLIDLVKLVAIKAAADGDVSTQKYVCEATIANSPTGATMVATVRITPKRGRKGRG
jgi:hypothetical protein